MNLGLIGANGQIGTELSFLLKDDVNLIPITRNRLGSIFLKHHDFPCRISDISKENDALESLSDLDSVVILSYATDPHSGGQTRSSQKINDEIIKNTIKFSKNNATIIYFSTIRAFSNSIVPNTSNFWIKSSFEKEKIHLENLLLSESKKNKKRAFILRMSQVFGDNQPRTHYFRDILSEEKVIIQVSPEKKSNIVHTVTIKDAITKCLEHEYVPGIYSLVNNPQWTWKDVIDYYKKPETIIEYKPQTIIEDKPQQSIQNEHSFFWNLLKSNKKFINPFLYYISPKYESQIQKKLAIKRISTAIYNLKKSKLMRTDNDGKLQSLQTRRYENAKAYLNDLTNNYIDESKIPDGLKDDLKSENLFSIEEFGFNPIPGPFLNDLGDTKKLLENYDSKMFFIKYLFSFRKFSVL